MLKKKRKIIICLASAFPLILSGVGSFVLIKNTNNVIKNDELVFEDNQHPVISNDNREHNIRMRNVGDTLTINATITPNDATVQTINWAFDEESASDNLTIVSHTGLSCTIRKENNYAGYYTLRATTVDNNQTATCKIYSTNYIAELQVSPCSITYANSADCTLRFQMNKSSDPARLLDTIPVLTESNIKTYMTFDNEFKSVFDVNQISDVNMANSTTSMIERLNFTIKTKADFLTTMASCHTKTVSVTIDGLTATYELNYVQVQGISLDVTSTNI